MELLLTEHAKQQMVTRGITIDQIKRTIQRGSRMKQTDGYLSSHTYLAVAWKKFGEYYKIKTVMVKD
ncbi:MAG TPA: DUF4258 domain-containing protein [Candidatus Nanoarchaeia archaeon]|nr:DUF4258 domain-containing protein [Candidatus Nanoarchaeia archaeon]